MSRDLREPRVAVMILVEAHWIDPAGTFRTAPARMENKSSLGACLRIRTQIEVGTRLSFTARREQFSGTARYCRREGCDYLIGVQKDTVPIPIVNPMIAAGGVNPAQSRLAVSSPVLSSGHRTAGTEQTSVARSAVATIGARVRGEWHRASAHVQQRSRGAFRRLSSSD